MSLVKNYVFPTIETISNIILVFLTILIGVWLSTELKNQPVVSNGLAFDTIKVNALSLETPVPYFLFFVLLSAAGRLEGFFNRYKYSQLQAAKSDLAEMELNLKKKTQAYNIKLREEAEAHEAELRKETQAHAESKNSYLETLEHSLRYLLTSAPTGFSPTSRLTIYRRQNNDDTQLKRIFRSSPTLSYENSGRLSVPIDEGVVGAAWSNHGIKEFECNANHGTEAFKSSLRQSLAKDGCTPPAENLTMPAKHLYAVAIQDHETVKRIAVVVYECTENKILNIPNIDHILRSESLNISRFIKHLGVLNGEFNPDTKGD